jgi:hypothetical protein
VNAGKGGAFVRTSSEYSKRTTVDKTFRAGEKIEDIALSPAPRQYLYSEGNSNRADGYRELRAGSVPKSLIGDLLSGQGK